MLNNTGITAFFDSLEDLHTDRTGLHPLRDIVGLTLCAVLSGCNDWEEIELYGKSKYAWLKTFLGLPHGIPSHDTINRLFASLDAAMVRSCFSDWVQSITCAAPAGRKGLIHWVGVWSKRNHMVLGPVNMEGEDNEAMAVPGVLEILVLEGSIITIDTIEEHDAVTKRIRDRGADYVWVVKEQQTDLVYVLKEVFGRMPCGQSAATIEMGQGRIERSNCTVIPDADRVIIPGIWKGLRSVIKAETRIIHKTTRTIQEQQRYYLSSVSADPRFFNDIARRHQGIENKLHWCLDISFKEDYSTRQAGNAAENFNTITKAALDLLRAENSEKRSIKSKRLRCGWDQQYLESLLFQKK